LYLLRGRAVGLTLGALYFMCSIVAVESPPNYYGIRTYPLSATVYVGWGADVGQISLNLYAFTLTALFIVAYAKRPLPQEHLTKD
jgi:hypothetical protein